MRGKDLLTAIQVDATGELTKLSTYQYVYVKAGEQLTNHLAVTVSENRVILTKAPQQVLTLNQLIHVLNEAKDAEIFVEEQLIFGYRLVDQGIFLG